MHPLARGPKVGSSPAMFKILGILLNVAGVLVFWFGGVPYKEKETVLQIGSMKADVEIEKKAEIPKPVAATLIGVGTVLLLVPGRRKS